MKITNMKEIQCNILEGHGRNHSSLIFMKFKGIDKTKNKLDLFGLAKDLPLNTAFDQQEHKKLFKSNGVNDELLVGIYLSSKGYDAIGMSDNKPLDEFFRDGFKDSINKIYEKKQAQDRVRNVMNNSRFGDSHIAILLASDQVEKILNAKEFISTKLTTGEILVEESSKIYKRNSMPIEHFGFYDGLAKSKFKTPEEIESITDANRGSYFAFLKYEQNVHRFEEKVEYLSKSLNITPMEARAQVMGVFKETGQSLTEYKFPTKKPIFILSNSYGVNNIKASKGLENINHRYSQLYSNNSYEYTDDNGIKCPFHSHARKMKPRNKDDRSIIARRGVTYGERSFDAKTGEFMDSPKGGVGLMFMSFQKDIKNNLANMLIRANKRTGSGIDPIIGENPNKYRTFQNWNSEWGGNGPKVKRSFHDAVSFSGGEFFYAPPISFFK